MAKIKRLNLISLILVLVLNFSGCMKPKTEITSRTIFAMDTVMELSLYGDSSKSYVLTDAEDLIKDLEAKLSVTDSQSEIYNINKNKTAFVSADTASLINSALSLCSVTDGALDISIYPLVSKWGFTTGTYSVPSDNEISKLLSNVDYSKIILSADSSTQLATVSIEENMAIDLGSVAKGYTSDLVCELMKEKGISNAIISLGGNVQTIGTKPDGTPFKIAIANPFSSEKYIGYVEATNKAVITSGGYQRFFEENGKKYHHIIDPSTGYPADNELLSVTIVGEKGIICDGLSTALFVMGYDRAVDFWKNHCDTLNFDVIFVLASDNVIITDGLEKNFHSLEQTKFRVISK